MATKSTDVIQYVLNKYGDFGIIYGEQILNLKTQKIMSKYEFLKYVPLSFPEYKFFTKIEKYKRMDFYHKDIFKKLNKAVSNEIFTIKVNEQSYEIRIIDKYYNQNELLIKFITKDAILHRKPASEISDIVRIENIEFKTDNQPKVNSQINTTRNDKKSIEDGFYIVTDKLSTCDSGSIIRVIKGIAIDSDDFRKHLDMNDMEEMDKLDKIEQNESIYLLKYKINERIEKHKNKIFNKIKELNIGDKCYYKNDFSNIYIVEQINIDRNGIKFVLQLKNWLEKREINADAIDIGLIENSVRDKFYILTEAKHPHHIGTIFRVENGFAKTFPDNVAVNIQPINREQLRKIYVVEANYLKMFQHNKRMKNVLKEKFKRINELSIGDKCFVNGKEFIVDRKYLICNELKFDLRSKKYSEEILVAVNTFNIKLKNILENIQSNFSSINRQNSTRIGASNEKIRRKSKIEVKNEPYESMIIPVNDRLFGDIDINSDVKYYFKGETELKGLFGTVRWSGKDENNQYLYGIELNDRFYNGTDGQFNGQRLFNCQNGHGILVPIDSVAKDSRFDDLEVSPEDIVKSEECKVKELSILTKLSEGLNKGIQGNANSCYFDSAIFALFVKSDVLDFMIDEINNETETNEITKQFRLILSKKIIYPLRKFGFVSFHRTNEMRDVIVQYGGQFEEMTKQESDMENVSALLSKLCPDEKLLSIISHSGSITKCMFMQLFLTLTNKEKFMTSEEMLKIFMVQNDIMFNELPTCLIMKVPRDARGINCYEFVIPMNTIEISQLCSNYFKQCFYCENAAVYQCKECIGRKLISSSFHCKDAAVCQCKECIEGRLDISSSFLCEDHKCDHNSIMRINISNKSISKVYLELKSIICIEKCHFVSYVKQSDFTNRNIHNRWYFFDSMSSKSISNNYSIPKVAYAKEVTDFLNANVDCMKDVVVNYDFAYLKRIVKDSYIFVYQNSTKTCY